MGNTTHKYTAADSQLHMTFNNKDIVVDTGMFIISRILFLYLKTFIYCHLKRISQIS